MELKHEFTVPVPAGQAWDVLLDIERIAPCMPGATVTSVEGDEFRGRVKVKVGPISVTYGGVARFAEKDAAQRRAVIEANAKETRGSGTAKATITAQLHDEGQKTRVTVLSDLAITGKPAQFGRGVMVDVGNKLLGLFADCLAEELSSSPKSEPEPPALTVPALAAESGTTVAAPGKLAGPAMTRRMEAIDLLGAAGAPVLKRIVPVAGGVAVLGVLLWGLRRALSN